MRVTGGSKRGQIIKAGLKGGNSPMAEKLRHSLFSALGDIEGLRVLDGFAGSGSVGIEALSRGASFCQFVESDRKNFDLLLSNLRSCRFSPDVYKATNAAMGNWQRSLSSPYSYDLVLLDPPFNNIRWQAILDLSGLLNPGGVFVVNLPKNEVANFEDELVPDLQSNEIEPVKILRSGVARMQLLKKAG